MRRWLAALGLLLLVGAGAASQTPWQRHGAAIEQGDREYLARRLDAAMDIYRTVAAAGDSRGFQRMAWLQAMDGRDDLALPNYLQALERDPHNRWLLLQAAGPAIRLQQWDLARDCLRRVLREPPPHLQAFFLMAILEIRQGRTPQGERWLRKGLEVNPYDARCNLELARLMAERQHFAAAAEHYGRAMGLAPEWDANASFQRGVALLHLQNAPAAMAAFRVAVDRNPRLANAWYMLGVLQHDLAPAEAPASLQRFLELQPAGPEADTARRLLGR